MVRKSTSSCPLQDSLDIDKKLDHHEGPHSLLNLLPCEPYFYLEARSDGVWRHYGNIEQEKPDYPWNPSFHLVGILYFL